MEGAFCQNGRGAPTVYQFGPVWTPTWTNRTPTGPSRDPIGHPRNLMETHIKKFEIGTDIEMNPIQFVSEFNYRFLRNGDARCGPKSDHLQQCD